MLVDQRRSRSDLHRVTVLGSFSVTAHGDPVPLESDARRVVAYLAVHRRPQRCPALAADLWPGLPAATAAALLDQSLVAAAPLLTDATDGTVALDPAVTVDLDEAMALVRELAIVPGHPDSVPADMPVATALLGADVLPDWTEAWLPVERERFRQIRLNALEELSSALTASGRFADAVVTARAAVHTAPSREGARRCRACTTCRRLLHSLHTDLCPGRFRSRSRSRRSGALLTPFWRRTASSTSVIAWCSCATPAARRC